MIASLILLWLPAASAQNMVLKVAELSSDLIIRCFEKEDVAVSCEYFDGENGEPNQTADIDISIAVHGKTVRAYGYSHAWDRALCDQHLKDIKWIMRKLKKTDSVCIASHEEGWASTDNLPIFERWHSMYTKYGKVDR